MKDDNHSQITLILNPGFLHCMVYCVESTRFCIWVTLLSYTPIISSPFETSVPVIPLTTIRPHWVSSISLELRSSCLTILWHGLMITMCSRWFPNATYDVFWFSAGMWQQGILPACRCLLWDKLGSLELVRKYKNRWSVDLVIHLNLILNFNIGTREMKWGCVCWCNKCAARCQTALGA